MGRDITLMLWSLLNQFVHHVDTRARRDPRGRFVVYVFAYEVFLLMVTVMVISGLRPHQIILNSVINTSLLKQQTALHRR